MSEPSRMRAYRACINLSNISNGSEILIDEDDGRWADWIAAGFIVPVGPPVDYAPPVVPITRENVTDLTRESRDDSTYETHISEQSDPAPEGLE